MLVMGPSKNLITPFLVSLSLLHIGVFFYFCICVCICIGLFSASRRQSSLGTTLPTSSWCRPSVSCPEFLANKGKLSGGKLPAVSHRSSKVYSRRILLILQRFLVTIISLPSPWSQVAQLSHLTYPFPPPSLRLPHVLIQPRIAGVHWWQREGGLLSLVIKSTHPPLSICDTLVTGMP